MSLTIFTTKGAVSPSLKTVSLISVFGRPRISFTASPKLIPLVALSSIFIIKSPALIPALAAGVSSIGATTLIRPSCVPTSIPNPPNSPWVPTCKSRKASASR